MTKHRRQAITSPHPERMQEITRDMSADLGTELRQLNGEPDHPHLLGNLPRP